MNQMLHANSVSDFVEKERRDVVAKDYLAQAELGSLDAIHHRAMKLGELGLFRRHFERFLSTFANARTIVELGGGSGWAAYYVKRRLPNAVVHTTDIAPGIIAIHRHWESFFTAKLDGAHCAKSYELPFEDGSVDLAFCFQAAHHFGRHRSTFRELNRILSPHGKALFLDEPVCGPTIYPLAHRRANKRLQDDGVPEDLLIYDRIMRLAEETGFQPLITFDPHVINRSAGATIYYKLLRALPFLYGRMPTTADLTFQKVRSIGKP
jgi:SAM-dependent methyltransferase